MFWVTRLQYFTNICAPSPWLQMHVCNNTRLSVMHSCSIYDKVRTHIVVGLLAMCILCTRNKQSRFPLRLTQHSTTIPRWVLWLVRITQPLLVSFARGHNIHNARTNKSNNDCSILLCTWNDHMIQFMQQVIVGSIDMIQFI